MLTFDLANLPLDVALRKLLMEVSLPRETQQIDRVMEAFAKQYLTSNPGLFVSEGASTRSRSMKALAMKLTEMTPSCCARLDHPYIIAFSLIMLHTDAFNRSNKNKMTKADYVKNTRLDGVNPLVLDVSSTTNCRLSSVVPHSLTLILSPLPQTFFENITYTPFVFIEDDNDINGSQSLSATDFSPSNTLTNPFGFSTTPTSSFLSLSKTPSSSSNKIDVYDHISSNRVHTLRCPEVQLQIPKRTPFDYHGPRGFFDTGALHGAFAEADMIEVEQQGEVRRGSASEVGRRESKAQSLKLTKYGILSRKGSSFSTFSDEILMLTIDHPSWFCRGDGRWREKVVQSQVEGLERHPHGLATALLQGHYVGARPTEPSRRAGRAQDAWRRREAAAAQDGVVSAGRDPQRQGLHRYHRHNLREGARASNLLALVLRRF